MEATPSRETTPARENLRVFISSPSDVRPERLNAKRLVEKLDREFGFYFRVEPVLWEREPLKATEHFQESITPPHETDIVVVILWSRLGVQLPPEEKFRGAITRRQVTGTEWEFEDAFASYRERQQPDLLFYLKADEIEGSFEDEAKVLQQLQQKKLVKDFMQRWFYDADDKTFKLAYNTFTGTADLVEMLEAHLRGLLEKRLKLSEGEMVQGGIRWHQGSPYRGLESFGLEHAQVFFGRTRARNELRELLARQAAGGCAFILVFGASGSGKSSLVKAGLLPDLKLPGMIGRTALCRHALLRPADAQGDLLGYLAAALLGDTALPELTDLQYNRAGLAELLREAPSQVKLAIRQGLTFAAKAERLTERAEARLALVIDQLEELFTLDVLTPEDRAGFVAALEALARSGLVWVVATMRSDFFDRLDELPALARLSAGEARYLLTLPEAAEISQIVRQPAREGGLHFEFDRVRGLGLDDELCQAAAQAPSALPLLEFTLDQLWQRRTERGELTFAAYQELGGLEGALGRRAEEEFSNLPAEIQAVLPQVLRVLATVGQGVRGAVTARAAPLTTFAPGSPQMHLVETFLAPQARLLVVEGDDAGARVRVAHEALLTHWERAREQLLLDRADLQMRARLEQAAALWQTAPAADQASRLLPAGLPLEEAKDLIARRRNEMDRTLVSYVGASGTAVEARLRRSRQLLQATAAVFAVLALMAGISAYDATAAKHRAQAALASQDFQEASRLRAVNHTPFALAYLVNALRLDPNNMAVQSVISDLLLKTWPLTQGQFQLNGKVNFAKFSPDGTRILTVSQDRTARLWDVQSGKPLSEPMKHKDPITYAEFSPDGTRIITASGLWLVQLWDAHSGKPLGDPIKVGGIISSVHFSPDGTRILTAVSGNPVAMLKSAFGDKSAVQTKKLGSMVISSSTGSTRSSAQLWDALSGKQLGEPMQHEGPVHSAQFSPDSTHIVTASGDNTARLWDAQSGKQLAEPMKHGYPVRNAQFSPDGSRIVTVSEDNSARLWDATSGKLLGEPMQHEGPVLSAQFSPDSTHIVTASGDNTARLWDARSGKIIGQPMRHEGPVYSAQFSPDSTHIVTASGDNTARLWDAQSGKQLAEPMKHGYPVRNAQFSPDGSRVVTVSEDNSARLWDAQSGNPLSEPMQHQGQVNSAQFSPDGTHIVTASFDNAARLWNAQSGNLIVESMQHENSVVSVRFSPDGRRIVTVLSNSTAQLWDVQTGKPLGEPMKHDGEVKSAQFSPDGNRLVTASMDQTARLWDTQSGKPLGESMRHDGLVYSAQFSVDGSQVVTASQDGTVRLWNARSGKPERTLKNGKKGMNLVVYAEFSPDGRRIVSFSLFQDNAQIWDARSGKPLGEPMKHEGLVAAAHFSPDGTHIVTASNDNTARLWDAQSGKSLGEPMKHDGPVNSAQFSPDGTHIVTAASDNTARLWDAQSGKPLGEPIQHEKPVISAQFSPEGSRIITVSEDKTARLWDTLSGKPLGEPIKYGGGVVSAQFSPDGTHIVTASDDHACRLLTVLLGSSSEIPLLAEFAEAVCGYKVDATGRMVRINDQVEKLKKLRADSAAAREENGSLMSYIRWFLADRNTRDISPGSPVTVPDYIKHLIEEGKLDVARRAFPGHPDD